MSEVKDNNKRIARNTVFLYIRMFLALIINLYTARLLLNALGVEDYGVYNVVAGFVSLFAFLNATLSSSVQRFYNYEGTTNGATGFRTVYVTSFLTHIFIAAFALLLLETFGIWYVNHIMVVPSARLHAANVLFQMSTLSLVLMTIQIPYVGAIMAKERMDYYAIVSIVDVILKFLIALFITWTEYDNLIMYGILLFGVSLIDFILYLTYCKNEFQEMKLIRSFDIKLFKTMVSFSSWNLIGTFAFMLKGQGINMLLNYFFGPVVNAARGIAYQVNGAISGFTSNVSIAFGPQVVKSYADGDITRTKGMMFVESKICFALIAILIVPISLEINYLLKLWLGRVVPDYTNIFAVLVLVDTLVCTLNTPCTQVVQATGNIKFYQIGSSIINILLLPLAWLFLSLGFSATSSFVVTIFVSLVNQIVCVILANKQLSFGLTLYLRSIVLKCLLFIIVLPILPAFIHILLPENFFRVVLVGCASVIAGIVFSYFIILGKDEKVHVKNFIIFNIKNRGYIRK